LNGAAHPLARFFDLGVCQSHQAEAGQAVGQMHLHGHGRRLQSQKCTAMNQGQGHKWSLSEVLSPRWGRWEVFLHQSCA
jgi:hypothetical protein